MSINPIHVVTMGVVVMCHAAAPSWVDDADAVDNRPSRDIAFSANRVVLMQNYPNPLVDHTTIPFHVPHAGHVTLKVFDQHGRDILTLLDRDVRAGTHRLMWSIHGLAKGVYAYQLAFGDETVVRRATVGF